MSVAKRWTHFIFHMVKLIYGLITYSVFRRTPPFSYQSMISLFCITNGHSSDALSSVIGFLKRPYNFCDEIGVLGGAAERDEAVFVLKDRGYYVFRNRLPAELCDQLLHYATSHPCETRPMDGDDLGRPKLVTYPREAPQAVCYDFATQDLLKNSYIQNLLADMSFAAVAQEYLGCRPVIDVLTMWWQTRFSDKPDMAAAQFYHFDMDRPKWLKFFIYLTDVESGNGPHTFIAGSHKSCGIPSSILRKGYARLTDQEIAGFYNRDDIIEFTAPRGTIIAEDTRGLHKGKCVEQGDRLILQIQFSNLLFGSYSPKARIGQDVPENLKIKITRFQKLYSAYL